MVRWRGNHEIWCWEWLQDRGIWTQTEDASYGHLLCALDPEKTVNVYHKYDPKTSLGAYALKQWLRVDWMAKRSRWTKDAELIVWNHKRHVVGFDNSGENHCRYESRSTSPKVQVFNLRLEYARKYCYMLLRELGLAFSVIKSLNSVPLYLEILQLVTGRRYKGEHIS